MQDEEGKVEAVTMTDILNLSSWDRPRSNEELNNFLSIREAAISGTVEE
jgi:hypothetical protein